MKSDREIEELREEREGWKLWLASSQWKRYAAVLNEQIEMRKNQELSLDIDEQRDVYEIVRLKAERRMAMLSLQLPETFIEGLSEEIDDE